MPDTPIDVLIPVYNGERWLESSLESIRAQTHRALTIHVVDDGSTDGTAAILARLSACDDRIRVHRQANTGIVGALNHGLDACSAEFVARHDADDLAYPERFARQLAYLQANPGCVAVGASARHIDADGVAPGTWTQLRPPEEADADWVPAREPYLMHPFMMARRAAVEAAGRYRHAAHSEDSDLYWRLHELGTLHNLPELLGDYRMHGASISSGSIRNGRLMAVGSQLAAMSARRRDAGQDDLDFHAAPTRSAADAQTLAGLVDTAAAGLGNDDRVLLERAVGAKLLELTSYLPYELESSDCRFIEGAIRRGRAFAFVPGNLRALATQCTVAAVRLWGAGRRADAARLLTPRLVPEFLARLAWRHGVPPALRERLRRWRRPASACRAPA